MAIKLSDKRLSTLQGQAGIVAAIHLEETLGNSEIKFEGDPSLRVLLVENIAKYPYSDDLFAIQVLCGQHKYEDSQARDAWIEKRLPDVTTPQVLALWANKNSYNASEMFYKLPIELIEKGMHKFSQHTLSQVLGDLTGEQRSHYGQPKKKRLDYNLRLLACFMRTDQPDIGEVERFAYEYIKRSPKQGTQQWVPAIVHMVNTVYGRVLADGSTDDVAGVIEHGAKFLQFDRKPGSVTATLYDPHKFKAASWLTQNKGRDDND